jgi:remodeling and spacing factor 1
MQFDVNVKFKNTINAKPSHELRMQPFGSDKDGNIYYVHTDEKANIKVFHENLDEETWSVVASNREELVKLIDELKGHKPIRPFPKDLIDEESSSSNSRLSAKEEVKTENPVAELKPAEQEQEYSIDNSASDEFPLRQTIRLIKKNDTSETKVEQSSDENAKVERDDKDMQKSISKSAEKTTAQKKRRRK